MLHIILVILKFIGILLAAVLLLLLLLFLLLLFVPLRYEIGGKRYPGVMEGSVRVTWLLRFISLKAAFQNGEPSAGVRILWFSKRLFPASEKPEKPKQIEGLREADAGAGKNGETKNGETKKQAVKQEKKLVQEESPAPKAEQEEQPSGTEPEEKENSPERKSLPARIWEWIKAKLLGVCRLFQKFLHGIANFQKGVNALKRRLMDWIELLGSDLFRGVVGRYRRHLFYLLKHIRPRKAKGRLRFGFADPSLTGQLAGALYLILPASCGKVELLPDFQEAVLEGEVAWKGHIRFCHLAYIGWTVFWDKELRRLIKRMRA